MEVTEMDEGGFTTTEMNDLGRSSWPEYDVEVFNTGGVDTFGMSTWPTYTTETPNRVISNGATNDEAIRSDALCSRGMPNNEMTTEQTITGKCYITSLFTRERGIKKTVLFFEDDHTQVIGQQISTNDTNTGAVKMRETTTKEMKIKYSTWTNVKAKFIDIKVNNVTIMSIRFLDIAAISRKDICTTVVNSKEVTTKAKSDRRASTETLRGGAIGQSSNCPSSSMMPDDEKKTMEETTEDMTHKTVCTTMRTMIFSIKGLGIRERCRKFSNTASAHSTAERSTVTKSE
jgi:hypothetical protein